MATSVQTGVAQSFVTPNYSGALFYKGNNETPFTSAIGGRRKTTQSVKFPTGQEYTGYGAGTQPHISEIASLTAPPPTFVDREQKYNVTQIFQKSVSISYAKQSNMGTLSGLNIAGQSANPMDELTWQTARVMENIAQDIEFTCMQGAFNEATTDSTVNKTRGMVEAITSNVKAMGSKPLGYWDVVDLMSTMYGNNAPLDNLVLWCDRVTRLQLNTSAIENGLTVVPAARDVNGIAVDKLVTPDGTFYIRTGKYLPKGTAMLLNLGVISLVEQPVPGKGNFFREELAKTGAGTTYQIFGQLGLDHGPEWYHGKFTGIKQTWEAPKYNKIVKVVQDAAKP